MATTPNQNDAAQLGQVVEEEEEEQQQQQRAALPGPGPAAAAASVATDRAARRRQPRPASGAAGLLAEPGVPGPSGLQRTKRRTPEATVAAVPATSATVANTAFRCEHCKKTFSSKFKLVRHALIHSDRKPFSCTVCERTFHRKDHLKNHVKVHSPCKKVFRCERAACRKEYTSAMSYRKHQALHAAQEGALDCKICCQLFSSQAEVLHHLKVHAGSRALKGPGEKKFTCDHCERRFFTRKDVRRHLVVHTGTRNFLCQFCPQRFGRKDHLVRHINKSHSLARLRADADGAPPPAALVKHEAADPADHDLDKIETMLEYAGGAGAAVKDEDEVEALLFPAFPDLDPMLCPEPAFLAPAEAAAALPELDVPPDVIMDNELLRLIGDGADSLPLPGFSQAFQQPPP